MSEANFAKERWWHCRYTIILWGNVVCWWTEVVPTALYRCKLWIMDDSSLTLIEQFQNYDSERVKQFHPKIPNAAVIVGQWELSKLGNLCSLEGSWFCVMMSFQRSFAKGQNFTFQMLSKFICHAGVLRADDFKLKSQPSTVKMCNFIDMFET